MTFYGDNPDSDILSSKATGEPSVNLSISVLFALRNAVKDIRRKLGEPSKTWFDLCKLNI